MHLIKRYVFAWTALAAVACSKQAAITKQEPDTSLTGNWQWVRTDGGIGNTIHETPFSTGKTIELNINSDSTFAVFANGFLTDQGTYSITYKTCIHDHAKKQVIHFSSGKDLMVERLKNNELYVSDENYDGVGSQYQRHASAIK
jgi:hypothetical protein